MTKPVRPDVNKMIGQRLDDEEVGLTDDLAGPEAQREDVSQRVEEQQRDPARIFEEPPRASGKAEAGSADTTTRAARAQFSSRARSSARAPSSRRSATARSACQIVLALIQVIQPAVDVDQMSLRLTRERIEIPSRLVAKSALGRIVAIALELGTGAQQPSVGDVVSVDKLEQC